MDRKELGTAKADGERYGREKANYSDEQGKVVLLVQDAIWRRLHHIVKDPAGRGNQPDESGIAALRRTAPA